MGQKDSLPNRDNVLQDSGDILSPIMKLNQDVLWRIFSVNANMDNDEEFRVYAGDKLKYRNIRALFITWHSSQVCQLWRHFILETSSLWAQLIDLDGLSSVDGLMKDEIMRRTGSCALSISGRVFGRTSSEQNFFVAILRRDWTRIRSFKVTIAQSKSIPGIIWNILSEPTETLEYFRLRADSGINPPDEHRPISNLFSNHAPSLRSFGSWRINFNFETGTNLNWLSNVHQINISYMTSMSLAQWLLALEQMPQLEDLQLIYPFPTPSSPESDLKLPSVHLPRLLNLYIIHDLTACAVFLDRILPGVGCYLYLDTPDDIDNPPPPSTLVLATKVLARFSQNWFASHAVSALYFSVTHAAITISEYRVPPPRNSLPTYRIYICCRDPSDLPTLFPLLDAYASCNFSNIETLHFDVDLFTDQRLNVDVFRFLARLHSVKSLLYSNEGTIPSLHSLARDSLDADETSGVVPASLFPHLHTIKVDSARSNLSSYITSPKEVPLELLQLQQVLSKFVIWRRVLQHPIQVVDITDLGAAAIVGIFDGIEGLQVIIRTEP